MKKIKLGCNWSMSLKKLLDEDVVRIDYIKTGVWGSFYDDLEAMLSHCSVLLHGLGYKGHTGMKNLDEVDFEKANELIEKCGSPHYGLHFGINNKNIDGMTDEEIYSFMSNQTLIFKKNIHVPLLLENTPYSEFERVKFDLYPLVNASYISEFINENDVFFLLDISHAKVAASFNGWDVKRYIRNLPLSKLKEIHINGTGIDEYGDIKDTHQSMKNEDYELLEWVLTLTNPDIVTLEYAGVEGESEEAIGHNLTTQLNRLNNIIKQV